MYTDKNFLVNHAYKHVWSGPGQDRQHILNPSRLSTARGARWNIDIGMSTYNLPSQGERYDVFAFGDVLPSLLGMNESIECWINGKGHCEKNDLLIDIYSKSGVRFPISDVWFLYTRNGNLIVALKRNNDLLETGKEAIYVRWRSAAYFQVTDLAYNEGIRIGNLVFTGNNSSYLTFRDEFLSMKARPTGRVIGYKNGYRIRDWAVSKLRSGDHLEWVWTADVKTVIEIKYNDLLSFDSTLDGKRKLLIPRPGLGDEIDYVDDVDVYILNYTKPAEYKGTYYHQNRVDSVRMVTHRDYSLCSSYVNSAMEDQGWSSSDDIRIECVVRHSGYDRELVDEHSRIKELFKLDEVSRLNAMIGSDSGVEVWVADNLESSSYLKLMRAKLGSIDPGLVIDAYGYNAVSRLTGLVPIEIPADSKFVDLFYGQYVHSTVYEYDVNGRMIGWYYHEKSRQYPVRNPETRYIEAYAGYGDLGLSTIYNSHKEQIRPTLSKGRSYRFYKGSTQVDGEMGRWEDVTGDDDMYTIVNNQVKWTSFPENVVTAIRNDLDFLSRDVELSTDDSLLLFTVGTDEVFPGRANVYTIMSIPPGEYDIMLNGYDLVEGIDYYCNWPEFCIVSKRYRDLSLPKQRVTIRARGFCRSDMSFDQPQDSGFVIHNQLSRNGRFNLRDDKVTRITVGGVVRTLDEVGFAEDGTLINSVPNGTPYRITHPYIPLMDLIPGDTYDYRELSLIVDREIEGYMDEYNPEDENNAPNPIQERYQLISPFISKIMEDMLSGFVTTDEFEGNFGQQELAARFAGYEYLLEYDPVIKESREDLFTFLPHQRPTVELDLYQFRVLDRLIDTFLQGKIDLERYVTIIAKE